MRNKCHRVVASDFKRERFWVQFSIEEIKYLKFFALVSSESAALSFANQHAMPQIFVEKRGKECFNTRFFLPTILCAEYTVKLREKGLDDE